MVQKDKFSPLVNSVNALQVTVRWNTKPKENNKEVYICVLKGISEVYAYENED